LDTCAAVTPRRLETYFELAPGQQIGPAQPPSVENNTAVAVSPRGLTTSAPIIPANQECPVAVIKATSTDGGFRHALADRLTKSDAERTLEKVKNGGRDPHYLDIEVRNESKDAIKAIEAFAVYTDKMGDEQVKTKVLFQNDKNIRPGGKHAGYSIDTFAQSENGKGEVTVFVNRVRFDDNRYWQDNGSHSCALTTKVKQ
jgi:hypothetical protein